MPIGLNLKHKLFIVQKFETQISIKKHVWIIFCSVLAFFEQLFRSILCIIFAFVLAYYTLYNFFISISWITFCFVVTCYLKKHVWIVFA